MYRRQPVAALLILALAAACGAPAASPSPAVSGTLTASVPTALAVPVAHTCADAFPNAVPDAHSRDAEPDGRTTDALADAHLMVVRAYFLLRDGPAAARSSTSRLSFRSSGQCPRARRRQRLR